LVAANTVGEVVTDQWGNKKLYPFFPGTQEKVALLSSNANEYAGERDPDWNGTNWEYYDSSNTKHLSIADMVTALQANKLPLNSYNWVSIGHTADGWYSDWIVTLTEAQTTTFASNVAKTLNAWSGGKTMTVDLPASYKKEDGTAYTGNVKASYAYLNPENTEFAESMPGNLAAIRSDQSEAELVSYGMVAVDLTGENGEKLQPGAPATLTFPVDPAKMKFTPSDGHKMPLWSFNEETGLWVEEGEATYSSSLQAYVGTVDHFSWHNLDYPESRASLQVKVLDKYESPIVGIPVDFDGQRISYTNAEGVATCVVPSNTDMVISIESSAYGNYADDEYGWPDQSKIIKQNVTLSAGDSKMITLQMPAKAPVISGTVINEGSGSKLCTLWIVYGNALETNRVVSDLVGKFSIIAPTSFRGTAKLIAMFGDGSKAEQAIEITDADQTVDITVNSSAVAGAGLIVVAGEGLNTWYQIPDGNNGVWDGEVSVDANNKLTAYFNVGGNNKEWGGVNVTIPDYNESKTSYVSSSNAFNYFKEGMGGWTQIECRNGELTIEVTKNGDVYSFKVNGPGTLIDRSLGMDWDTALPVTVGAEFSIKNVSVE
jgi:hypothetical protein